MTKVTIVYDTNHPVENSTWMDYISLVEMVGYTLLIVFCSVFTFVMAAKRRYDILIKHPIGLQLMYLGSWLHVLSVLVVNQQLSFLDPILLSNVGCMIWSFWMMLPGVLLWYSFFLYSLLSYLLYCMRALTEKCIVKKTDPKKTGYEMEIDNRVDLMDVKLNNDPETAKFSKTTEDTEEYSTTPTLKTVIMTIMKLGWIVPVRYKVVFLRFFGILFIMLSGFILCVIAQSMGGSHYSKKHDTCTTDLGFKITLIAMFNSYLALLWIIFITLKKRWNLPDLYSNDYKKILIATTIVAEAMIFMNFVGFSNYSVGRSFYITTLIAMYVVCIWYISGRSIFDFITGRRVQEKLVNEALNQERYPKTFSEIKNNQNDPECRKILRCLYDWLCNDLQCNLVTWVYVGVDSSKLIGANDGEVDGEFSCSIESYHIRTMKFPQSSPSEEDCTILRDAFTQYLADGYFPIMPWKMGHLHKSLKKRKDKIKRYLEKKASIPSSDGGLEDAGNKYLSRDWETNDKYILKRHFAGFGFPDGRSKKSLLSWFITDNTNRRVNYVRDACPSGSQYFGSRTKKVKLPKRRNNKGMTSNEIEMDIVELDEEGVASALVEEENGKLEPLEEEEGFVVCANTDTLPVSIEWYLKLKRSLKLHGEDSYMHDPFDYVSNFMDSLIEIIYWPDFIENCPKMKQLKVNVNINRLLMESIQSESGVSKAYMGPDGKGSHLKVFSREEQRSCYVCLFNCFRRVYKGSSETEFTSIFNQDSNTALGLEIMEDSSLGKEKANKTVVEYH